MARKTKKPVTRYKIVAICQIYNELEKGNLERFVKYLKPLVDDLVVYDDGSTDGSYEYMLQQTPYVIRGTKNDFRQEISHKKMLLASALSLAPDFILHIDADEVLSASAEKELQKLCRHCEENAIDAISTQYINLWRCYSWKRIDSSYDDGWFVKLWRVTPELSYGEVKPGLHQAPYPSSIKKIEKTEAVKTLHYGFSSEIQIAYKYLIYRAHGQRGYTMLDRLISEEALELVKVPKNLFPAGLWVDDEKPNKLTMVESMTYIEKLKEQVERPKFSIVCLIYKSVDWLKFVHEQVLKYTDMTDKEFFFVANDANQTVLDYLEQHYIPYYSFTTTPEQKKEWYINNVYRAWNFGAQKARGNFIIFINSDMAFSPGWLDKLWQAYNGGNCVASRLVESGKLRSGLYGIEKNFGTDYTSYQEEKFQAYATSIQLDKVENSGLFMPLLIRRDYFLSVGGYPEGNVTPGSNDFRPKIAKKDEPLISGDVILMNKLKAKGVTHQTAFNSIVYHFQEGEMDSSESAVATLKEKQVAICNDLVTGRMGEKVLWDFMLESLPASIGIDQRVVGEEGDYATRAREYIRKEYPQVKAIVQNATFINFIDSLRYTICFLQDDLRSMKRSSLKQEKNLHSANLLVANSIQTALSYPEYSFHIIPVGTNIDLFKPLNKKRVRKELGFDAKQRIGIFVGNFSEVKGWGKVKECVDHYPEIMWILVSKHDETYAANNVKVFNRVPQEMLVKLLNCADFFIIGSPVETQCLAAIEACCCNIPVIMRLVGIFRDWTAEERARVGIFSDDFIMAVKKIQNMSFEPRQTIIDKKLTVGDSMVQWKKLLQRAFQEVAMQQAKASIVEITASRKHSLRFEIEYLVKYMVLRRIFRGKDVTFVDFVVWLRRHLPAPLFALLASGWGMVGKVRTSLSKRGQLSSKE